MDVARRRGDDVEVVEQPLRRRGRGLLTCILCEGGVDLPQRTHVSFQAAQVETSAAPVAGHNR